MGCAVFGAIIPKFKRLVSALVLTTIIVATIGCEDSDEKCRKASNKASYSTDYDEMKGGMEYFSKNCTWRDGQPAAR